MVFLLSNVLLHCSDGRMGDSIEAGYFGREQFVTGDRDESAFVANGVTTY